MRREIVLDTVTTGVEIPGRDRPLDWAQPRVPKRILYIATEDWSLRLAIVGATLAASVLLLFLTSPTAGDFANADAPRHALNGAFVLDFLKQLPLRHPVAWAFDYYMRWPSLSIGFYPPLFYGVEAAVYAAFGVSHAAAQATVAMFTLLLAASAYAFARMLLPTLTAVGVAILLLGCPEISFWARQVMLDIPMLACVAAGAVIWSRYLRDGTSRQLALATACFVAAIYVKFTACFLLVPVVASLIAARGFKAVTSRPVVITALTAGLLVLPAVVLTWQFGRMNLENVAAPVGAPVSSLWRWTEYAALLPSQLGWLPLILALPGAVILWRDAPRPWAIFVLSWIAFGYVFFSAISIHDSRHDQAILLPIIICAAVALQRVAHVAAGPAMLALGASAMVMNVFYTEPYRVSGYAEVADYVADHAPRGSVVLFDGYRDGNFVFDLRARGDRGDLAVLRANKLLVHYAVTRDWGVTESGYNRDGLKKLLSDSGVAMVVARPGFWSDLHEMALLEDILRSSDYREVAQFPVEGSIATDDGGSGSRGSDVIVFVPTTPPAEVHQIPEIYLPFIARTLRQSDTGP